MSHSGPWIEGEIKQQKLKEKKKAQGREEHEGRKQEMNKPARLRSAFIRYILQHLSMYLKWPLPQINFLKQLLYNPGVEWDHLWVFGRHSNWWSCPKVQQEALVRNSSASSRLHISSPDNHNALLHKAIIMTPYIVSTKSWNVHYFIPLVHAIYIHVE